MPADSPTTQEAGRLSNAEIDALSALLRETGTLTREEVDAWQAHKQHLNEAQLDAIKAKCRWERRPWLGVLADWPSMFYAEETTDGD